MESPRARMPLWVDTIYTSSVHLPAICEYQHGWWADSHTAQCAAGQGSWPGVPDWRQLPRGSCPAPGLSVTRNMRGWRRCDGCPHLWSARSGTMSVHTQEIGHNGGKSFTSVPENNYCQNQLQTMSHWKQIMMVETDLYLCKKPTAVPYKTEDMMVGKGSSVPKSVPHNNCSWNLSQRWEQEPIYTKNQLQPMSHMKTGHDGRNRLKFILKVNLRWYHIETDSYLLQTISHRKQITMVGPGSYLYPNSAVHHALLRRNSLYSISPNLHCPFDSWE